MILVSWMRTGTAFAFKMSGSTKEDPLDQSMACVCDQLTEYLRRQAQSGRLDHWQIQKDPRCLRVICIPKPRDRTILETADCFAGTMEKLAHAYGSECKFFREEA